MARLIIPCELPSMNEIIKENRRNKYAGAKQKKEYTEYIAALCRAQKVSKIDKKIDIEIIWRCKNRRKDKDNISAGIKFILDGMVTAGVIENDGWDQIGDIRHRFLIDKKIHGIEVLLREVEA